MKVDTLDVKIFPTRVEMGQVAAKDIHDKIMELLSKKEEINMIFAAAPSQNDVLLSLTQCKDIPWNRINAYHMDEYIGLSKDAPQGFGNFLMEHIFGLVPFKSINLIDCEAKDPEAECERYGKLLKENPTDIVVMGIGENGHIAFNEPGSSLSSKTRIKTLTTDTIIANSRFFDNDVNKVPKQALTVGVGTVMAAEEVIIICSGHNKARALKHAIEESINHMWTVSALQMHPHGIIVCDEPACAEIKVGTHRYFKDKERIEGLVDQYL